MTLSIDKVIGQYIHLRKSGNKFTGKCPFHDDRSPSFVVYPETSSYYCFGCKKSGDIFRFVMEIEKLSFKDAVEALSRYSGI
ncbi:MAG: CHC2 zinc finger domain-containing protein [Ignavibacteriales bacterium]